MPTIEVDFDVFKELTIRRPSEDVTENDIMRELLGIGNAKLEQRRKDVESYKPWVTKGIMFPHGTEFRANYKGQIFYGRVDNGALLLNGKRFSSPSAAAMSITNVSVNGWVFWECKKPSSKNWVTISSLRK